MTDADCCRNISIVPNLLNIRTALSYDDVLLVPKYSDIASRSQVNLKTKISDKLTLDIPLITINMDTVTGVEMAIAISKLGGLGFLPRFDKPEIQAQKVADVKKAGATAAAAVGIKNGYLNRTEMLVNAGATVITIDVAHGHMQNSLNATKEIKNKFGDKITLISGVIGTYDGAKDLFSNGADCVRVGVGPGSICTTRIMTGVGVPQITAICDASRAARECGKTVLADGGIKNSGDIVKALACGASAIVSGFLFAGTDEAPGNVVDINGKKYKEYNGSTSYKEKMRQMQKDANDKDKAYTRHVEGIEALVPYKGPISNIIEGLAAGIRSGLSYSGAKNIEELWEKGEFIQVTQAGIRESNAHDVILVKD